MREVDWIKAADALAAEHAARLSAHEAEAEAAGVALPLVEDLRRALVEIDLLFRSAPTAVENRYKRISESDLRDLTKAGTANLDAGSLAWPAGARLDGAAAQLRALDAFLRAFAPLGPPVDPNMDFLCHEHRTHVIPRHAAAPPANPAQVRTLTYARRGLVHHRLIPAEISGYDIELHWHRDLFLAMRSSGSSVVGAIFQDLTLVRDPDFQRFVAADAPCADEDATLRAQVDAIRSPEVKLAVWPELTMPPERLAKLTELLRERALATSPASGACIIAAGSWHEVEDGEVRNRMHLLSAMGRPRLHHDKSIPLESRTLGNEELTPSYRIPVLITEDALVTFAICRDFCESQISEVYRLMDVDLVVVPSYGDLKTIDAHRQQAGNLFTTTGARVFVVQQVVPEEVAKSGMGYILPPEVDPTATAASTLVTASPGATYPISFKRV
ncbi:hypothetical protein U1763_02805 [Sphingomonas sp. LB2R24]|uniref:hypothetical protein n=1 Tax=Sphingomonas sorbitolis TaxID=3096165 RepID=UPI002FC8A79E